VIQSKSLSLCIAKYYFIDHYSFIHCINSEVHWVGIHICYIRIYGPVFRFEDWFVNGITGRSIPINRFRMYSNWTRTGR
jgi:hypothetical protein